MGEAPLRRGGKAGQRLHMLTAEEVVAQAAAEGLELETSRFASGYKGVTPDGARYQARVLRAGELVHLGSYVTAEEAALAVARTPEARAQVARSKAVPFTAEEVVAQAAAEGLKLETSNFASGYKGVIYKAHTDKYEARVRRAGKQVYLGCFVTPEEAALTIARACPAASPRPAALTAQEAVAQAAAEGLKLEPASNVELGYRGVCYNVESSRYHATVTRAGKHVHLGYFVTAEEAALAIARADASTNPPAAKRAVPPPPPQPLVTPPLSTPKPGYRGAWSSGTSQAVAAMAAPIWTIPRQRSEGVRGGIRETERGETSGAATTGEGLPEDGKKKRKVRCDKGVKRGPRGSTADVTTQDIGPVALMRLTKGYGLELPQRHALTLRGEEKQPAWARPREYGSGNSGDGAKTAAPSWQERVSIEADWEAAGRRRRRADAREDAAVKLAALAEADVGGGR